MKKTGLLVLAVTMVFVSCETFKKTSTADAAYEPAINTDTSPKVFSMPEVKVTKPTIAEEKPIAVRKESVTFANQADKTDNENNNYFVIVGSFSSFENAVSYRQGLVDEGFTPIILHSKQAGYYRLCVNSFKSEMDARQKVHQIRDKFPKYFDSWLLIKE